MNPDRIMPGPGQEYVWDYPRPPLAEPVSKRIQVIFNKIIIADSVKAWRVLETSHPPVYYLPQDDIRIKYLVPIGGRTFCEWKGEANYYSIVVADRRAVNAP